VASSFDKDRKFVKAFWRAGGGGRRASFKTLATAFAFGTRGKRPSRCCWFFATATTIVLEYWDLERQLFVRVIQKDLRMPRRPCIFGAITPCFQSCKAGSTVLWTKAGNIVAQVGDQFPFPNPTRQTSACPQDKLEGRRSATRRTAGFD